MSIEKKAAYWDSTKNAIAKLLGLTDASDTEVVDAALEREKVGKKADTKPEKEAEKSEKTEEKPEKEAEKVEKEAKKDADTEGGKKSDLEEIKELLSSVTKTLKTQGEAIEKIQAFKASNGTGGTREVEEKKDAGRKYDAKKDAPNFAD